MAALVGLEETGDTAEQGFWGFRKLVEALARERPTVVVFDDVNWGEPRFLELIEHLAESVRDAPLMVVCMARPELLELRPSWGGGKRNATSIFLEPLSENESRELLANLLDVDDGRGRHGPDPALGRGKPALRRGDGVDADRRRLPRRDGNGGAGLEELPVPPSIQVLLASRLDQLSVGERRAIERAAVEGNVFHSGAVEALSDDDPREQVRECLDALVHKELIVPYRASFAGVDGFRFRHVLIRDAAYEAVPKQIRADLHERYAAWLEEVAGDRLPELEEVLGYHLEQAYRWRLEVLRLDDRALALAARAGVRLGAAGRRALARGDVPAAVNLLDRAVSILPEEARTSISSSSASLSATRASSPAPNGCCPKRSTRRPVAVIRGSSSRRRSSGQRCSSSVIRPGRISCSERWRRRSRSWSGSGTTAPWPGPGRWWAAGKACGRGSSPGARRPSDAL